MPGLGRGGPGGGPGGGWAGRFAPVQKPRDVKKVLSRLMKYYMTEFWTFLLILVFVIGHSAVTLIVPYQVGRAVRIIGGEGGADRLSLALLVLCLCYAGGWLCDTLQGVIMAGATQRIVARLRTSLFGKFQKLSVQFFDTTMHGDLMSRVTNDIDNISTTIAGVTTQLMSVTITLVGSFVMMTVLSPVLTLASAIVIPMVLLLTRFIARKSRPMFSQQQRSLGRLTGIMEESFTGLRVIKTFNREPQMLEEYSGVNEDLRVSSTRAQVWSGIMMPAMGVINNICFAALAGLGAFLAVRGMIDVGTIATFAGYSRQLSQPLGNLAAMYNQLQSALAGAERVFEILDTEEERPDPVTDLPSAENLKGRIEFRGVTFHYRPDAPVLKDVSFMVEPGQTIALVGQTGAGKTTIVNLLSRFYDPVEGQVLLDGRDLKDYRRADLRHAFAVVLQDTCLFSDTIRGNIRYGRPEATDAEVEAACVEAEADAFIRRLPKGYETFVQSAGESLSQGQRQLLAIARAMLCHAPILILDEATSSVDTRTEQRIQRAMLNLSRGHTAFVIAHRLSTIRHADRIMVVQDGGIAESGTHEELLALGGLYAGMYRAQMEGLEVI